MIEMEEESQTVQSRFAEKDKAIARLQMKVDQLESGLKSGDIMTAQNLDGMADLDAKLAFVTNEKNEMQQELEYVRSTKNTQI